MNSSYLVEPALIFGAILGYCVLQAHVAQNDQRVEMAEQAKPKSKRMICQIRQNQDVHLFECTVINPNLAVIK